MSNTRNDRKKADRRKARRQRLKIKKSSFYPTTDSKKGWT